MSCIESAAQPDPAVRDHWTFGAGYVHRVALVGSLRVLIIKPPDAVFVLGCTWQKGSYGWQYLASYGALIYALSVVNQSVLTIGKAHPGERRCRSECVLIRDMKMWPLCCRPTERVRCTKGHIGTRSVHL